MRPFLLVICGTMFPFAMTALGASAVFFFRNRISLRAGRLCFGFAGGVMSAAAVFSLLLPAVQQLRLQGGAPWITVVCGFLAGAGMMLAMDLYTARRPKQGTDGAAHRRRMLISAITLHNIPEGMAVGIACAAAAGSGSAAAAAAVALGIGVQNMPEGAAIALPLRQSGMSRRRSFTLGALSGAVEPVAGIAAALGASAAGGMMPLLMAFSAGAMMWVVLAEMLPEAGARRDGALAAAIGYALMMALDLWLG